MGKRTNTAHWTGKHWRIDVQHNGRRRSFYSAKPGRTGPREANAKADAWLDDGINPCGERISTLYPRWFATMQETTSAGNCRNIASRWKIWILPMIGSRRITSLTEQDVQEVVNKAYAAGKSKKTLKSLCADMRAFFKYCRLCRLSTFNPEALHIPAGARYKGKQILQPADLVKLFNIKGEQTRGKNENAVRSFTVSALARRVLDAQRAETGSTGSVFQITSEPHYYRRWKVYCAANGLPPCSLYELRHTFASVVKTLPAGEVKGLVGHSEDMDTFGVYSHTLAGDAENTARAVNGVFLRVLKNA